MTPLQSAAPAPNSLKVIVASLIGMLAVAYLGAYFFLLLLKLTPTQASPLTLPRYAYYYWNRSAGAIPSDRCPAARDVGGRGDGAPGVSSEAP